MSGISVDLDWNDGFRQAVEWTQGSREALFITGPAGSGKSTLLRYLRRRILPDTVVLAPTGVAALAVEGETLHAFFRLPPRVLFPWEHGDTGRSEILRRLHTLILDEVSLVRADLFTAMEATLRRFGPEPGAPFGGVRLILFGDLHQLPPVVTRSEQEALSLANPGPWFFQTEAFRKLNPRLIRLEQVYRQRDPGFLDLLERARHGQPDAYDIDQWNTRVARRDADTEPHPALVLTSTNAIARKRNAEALSELPGPEYSYPAVVESGFDASADPAPEILRLREGAQVMFQRNDPERRWVNGTLGRVVGLEKEAVLVLPAGRTNVVRVARETWRQIRYDEDPATGRLREVETGAFHQIPLKPAWAVTVHKCQGQEFDQVHVDLGRRAFAHGQAYVALSRCTRFSGLRLERALRKSDFKIDAAVKEFWKRNTA